jgi:hypothetical protein
VGEGAYALGDNTTGNDNIGIGESALFDNTTGTANVAIGSGALTNNSTGTGNIALGHNAGESLTTGNNNIDIGFNFLGTLVSSRDFKDAIKPMDKASEAILGLKPVTLRYKPNLDPNGIPQFGLVAEDVAKVNPELVARDANGKPYALRYEAVNAMLLNEFLKEHRKVELQGHKAQAQQKEIDALKAELKEQKALILGVNPSAK